MNYIEEIKKFELIKNSNIYEMAKLEVLLRMDKVYIWTKGGHIAVLSSNNGNKSIYVYTNKELITSNESEYEEFTVSKFIIVLKNRNTNFNNCLINNNTEYSIKLSDNISDFINRYENLYTVSSNNTLEIGERSYIVAKEAIDENNIDVLIRSSENDKYIYIYNDSNLAKNQVYRDQLASSKLVGLSREKFNRLVTNLRDNGVNKVIVNFGTNQGKIINIEELINETL